MKWNEVTWYSRWGAIILFLLILPLLSFYIGSRYEEVKQIDNLSIENLNNSPNSSIQPFKSRDYYLHIISSNKELEIKEGQNIIVNLKIKDIPQFNDDEEWENNYTFSPFGTYDEIQIKAPYDSKRNEIYFKVADYPISGNVNTSQALFTYNVQTKAIKKVIDIFGIGLSEIYLSPNYNYLVYDEGDHGGACQDMVNLSILNLNSLKEIGSTQFELGNDNIPLEFGYTTLTEWINDKTFKYIQHYEKIEGCSERGVIYANENSPTREKVFTIE